MRRTWLLPAVLLALGLALTAGCSAEPRAPPLVSESMFQNAEVGLRFLAPNGWSMTSRSHLPAGKLPQPVRLVNYISPRGERPAEFAVVVADETADPAKFVDEFLFGPSVWSRKGLPESVTSGQAAGTRFTFSRHDQGEALIREVTAVPRGKRLVLFYLVYAARDRDNRDVGRACLESVAWTK